MGVKVSAGSLDGSCVMMVLLATGDHSGAVS